MEPTCSDKTFGTEGAGVQKAFLYPKPVGEEIGVPIGRSKRFNVQRSVASGRAAREAGYKMAWERRGSRSYYYRSVREGDRVRKVYVGTGPTAEQAAEADRRRRQRRLEERQRVSALVLELESAARFADYGREEFIQRASELLNETGYRYHRGSWRKRRG